MKKYFRSIYILFKLLGESFNFAYTSVKANKVRTFLSLLGVTIGIFSIITVLTMLDALENNIRTGINELGSDVIYIEKWPWTNEDGGEYKWWEYWQRPNNKYEEYMYLRDHCQSAEAVAMLSQFARPIKYKNNTLPDVGVIGCTPEWESISASFEVGSGRMFSMMEYNSGTNVAVIGYKVWEELFEGADPIGKTIKIGGSKVTVIGVLKKQGSSIVNMMDYDNLVGVTFNFARAFVNTRRSEPMIAIKAQTGIDNEEIKAELRMIMRTQRRLQPTQKDNFSLNEMTAITKEFEPVFSIMSIVGIIIGGFSVLIGGFGVANIMFVSVKERTNIIGIQKALGAKNYFILTQFLYEAVLLAIAGGILGLLLVYGGTALVSIAMDYPITLSLKNIFVGMFGSAAIGIVAGFMPAFTASRLDPVVAINSR